MPRLTTPDRAIPCPAGPKPFDRGGNDPPFASLSTSLPSHAMPRRAAACQTEHCRVAPYRSILAFLPFNRRGNDPRYANRLTSLPNHAIPYPALPFPALAYLAQLRLFNNLKPPKLRTIFQNSNLNSSIRNCTNNLSLVNLFSVK